MVDLEKIGKSVEKMKTILDMHTDKINVMPPVKLRYFEIKK